MSFVRRSIKDRKQDSLSLGSSDDRSSFDFDNYSSILAEEHPTSGNFSRYYDRPLIGPNRETSLRRVDINSKPLPPQIRRAKSSRENNLSESKSASTERAHSRQKSRSKSSRDSKNNAADATQRGRVSKRKSSRSAPSSPGPISPDVKHDDVYPEPLAVPLYTPMATLPRSDDGRMEGGILRQVSRAAQSSAGTSDSGDAKLDDDDDVSRQRWTSTVQSSRGTSNSSIQMSISIQSSRGTSNSGDYDVEDDISRPRSSTAQSSMGTSYASDTEGHLLDDERRQSLAQSSFYKTNFNLGGSTIRNQRSDRNIQQQRKLAQGTGQGTRGNASKDGNEGGEGDPDDASAKISFGDIYKKKKRDSTVRRSVSNTASDPTAVSDRVERDKVREKERLSQSTDDEVFVAYEMNKNVLKQLSTMADSPKHKNEAVGSRKQTPPPPPVFSPPPPPPAPATRSRDGVVMRCLRAIPGMSWLLRRDTSPAPVERVAVPTPSKASPPRNYNNTEDELQPSMHERPKVFDWGASGRNVDTSPRPSDAQGEGDNRRGSLVALGDVLGGLAARGSLQGGGTGAEEMKRFDWADGDGDGGGGGAKSKRRMRRNTQPHVEFQRWGPNRVDLDLQFYRDEGERKSPSVLAPRQPLTLLSLSDIGSGEDESKAVDLEQVLTQLNKRGSNSLDFDFDAADVTAAAADFEFIQPPVLQHNNTLLSSPEHGSMDYESALLLILLDRTLPYTRAYHLTHHSAEKTLACLTAAKLQLAAITRELSNDHPEVIALKAATADMYKGLDMPLAAEVLLKQVIDSQRRVLGLDHPDLVSSMNDLGLLLLAEQKYSEAQRLLEEVVGIVSKNYGVNHPDVAAALGNLAVTLRMQRNFAAAIPVHQRTIAILENLHGYDHVDAVYQRAQMGITYINMGAFQKGGGLVNESCSHLTDFDNYSTLHPWLMQLSKYKD